MSDITQGSGPHPARRPKFQCGGDFTDDTIPLLIKEGRASANKIGMRKYIPPVDFSSTTDEVITWYLDYYLENFIPTARNVLKKKMSQLRNPTAEQEIQSKCEVMRDSTIAVAGLIHIGKILIERKGEQADILLRLRIAGKQLPERYGNMVAEKYVLDPSDVMFWLNESEIEKIRDRLPLIKEEAKKIAIRDFEKRCAEIPRPAAFLKAIERRDILVIIDEKIYQAVSGPIHMAANYNNTRRTLIEFMQTDFRDEECIYKPPMTQQADSIAAIVAASNSATIRGSLPTRADWIAQQQQQQQQLQQSSNMRHAIQPSRRIKVFSL